jgi:catechol 2,3-dioxygenase
MTNQGDTMPETPPIIAGTRIGHVHLKVADLDRALGFYCGVLGFEVMQRMGDSAAFISAGGYHHHIGLNTWESKGGQPPAPGTTGLFHTAILYPSRPALADALHRVIQAGIQLDGASDHGVSEALYLRDPDQNGVELYWDRPKEKWPRTADGSLAMFTHRLDLDDLLRQREAYPPHGEERASLRASRTMSDTLHPSRRGQEAAPQDEGFLPPRTMISAAAASSSPMQP